MLVAHCTALTSAWPYRQSGRRARWVLRYSYWPLEGRASIAVTQRLPGSAPTTFPKRLPVRPRLFSEHHDRVKRHIAVDVTGLLLRVVVTAASSSGP